MTREITMTKKAKSDRAYVAVMEGRREGRASGWYLGIAVRGESGYYQLKPGYGPYKTEAAAREHATELNARLGLDAEAAALLVLSTMFHARGRSAKAVR